MKDSTLFLENVSTFFRSVSGAFQALFQKNTGKKRKYFPEKEQNFLSFNSGVLATKILGFDVAWCHFDVAWPKLCHKNGVFDQIVGCSVNLDIPWEKSAPVDVKILQLCVIAYLALFTTLTNEMRWCQSASIFNQL